MSLATSPRFFSTILVTAMLSSGIAVADEPNVLCTGLGEDERAEAASFDHTLKLVYAAPDGHYLGEVEVAVSDGDRVVWTGTCDGPWVMLNLAPGSYRVASAYSGQSKSETVRVGTKAVERTILFKSD